MTKLGSPAELPGPWWRELPILLHRAGRELGANDPLRLGAATAFFTSFALPPILIILIAVLGSLYSTSMVRLLLLSKLSTVLGASAAGLVSQIVMNVADPQRSRWVTWAGFAFLVFVATTLFTIIQHSLNQLWQIRPKRGTGKVSQALRERARSAGILLATAVLSLLAFASDAALGLFAESIRDFDATFAYYVVRVLNALVAWLILAAWFGVTFRTLSLAKVPWRAVTRGAALTAVLISLGEVVLGQLLVARDLGPVYGPASSLVLVLLFVFYCAMIFYFGAAFTKAYAHRIGLDIRPKKTAVRYRLVNVEDEH
ncbi:YihY/virulence factor BrkB family protein [Hymenobacter sp. BT523]|uniref:YihY/virulence factor BrkB family protein n=1 Tax=Hymenobacter sp. BT523 TaxID=2795725 RepID=UPI0018EB53E1|nr:YihY/virulence factor BrkB family protein [Hymenobacter sp. BT523]MBJ6110282.1 YihY/virulence factor BrkB family protein [Hymenobacter sp. BT523]